MSQNQPLQRPTTPKPLPTHSRPAWGGYHPKPMPMPTPKNTR